MADGKITIMIDLDGNEAQSKVKSLKSALLGIGESSSGGFGKGSKSAAMFGAAAGAATAIVQKGMSVISSSLGGAVSRIDTMNRFPKTMALFGYSAEESSAAVNKLSQGIEGLPTTLDSAVSSAQQLTITTGSLEKGTNLALAFNNAMLGYGATTEGAEQALRQFNQSLGSGKMQAEEFNSVSEAAPGLMQKMAESFGFGSNGVSKFKDALSNGDITAQQFADKLIELNGAQGGFAEMAQASAGGIATSFTNIKNAIVKNLGNIINAIDKAASNTGLGSIAENLDRVKTAINSAFGDSETMVQQFSNAFQVIFNPLMLTTFQQSLDKVKAAVNALGSAFNSVAGGSATWLSLVSNAMTTLARIIGAGADAARKFIQAFADTGALDSVSWALTNLLMVVSEIAAAVGDSSVWSTFGTVAGGVVKAVAEAFTAVLNAIMHVFESLSGGTSIIETLVTAFGEVIQAIARAVETAANFISALPPETIRGIAAAVLSAVVAFKALKTAMAIGGALKGIATTISMVKSFSGAVALAKYGWGLLTAALASNPFGWIAAAIAGVVAVLVYLWNTNEGFREACISAWEAIKNAVGAAWDFIKSVWNAAPEFFSGLWNGITTTVSNAVTAIKNAWNGIGEWFSNIWNGTKETATSAVEGIKSVWTGIGEWFSNLWTGIQTVFTNAWNAIVSAVMPIIQPFIDNLVMTWQNLSTSFSQIWEGIKAIFSGAWEAIKTIVLGPVLLICDTITGNFSQLGTDLQLIWDSLVTAIQTVWTGIQTFLTGIWNTIVAVGQGIWNNFTIFLSTLWTGITTTAQAAWEGLKNAIISITDGIVSGAQSAWNALKSGVISIVNGLVSAVQSAWNNLRNAVVSVINGLVSTVVSLWNGLKSSVVSIAQGIVNGAVSAFRGMVNGVSSVINSVKSVLNSLANINLASAGSAIMNSFLGGLKSAWGAVQNFVGGIASWIKEHKGPISYDRRLLIPAGKAIMQGLNNGLVSSFDDVKSTINSVTGMFEGFNYPKDITLGISAETHPALEELARLNQKVEDIVGVGYSNFSRNIQVKSEFEKAVKARVEIVQEKSNNLLEKAMNTMDKLADRPIEMRMDDDVLVARTGNKFQSYQNEQVIRQNRMRGIT